MFQRTNLNKRGTNASGNIISERKEINGANTSSRSCTTFQKNMKTTFCEQKNSVHKLFRAFACKFP